MNAIEAYESLLLQGKKPPESLLMLLRGFEKLVYPIAVERPMIAEDHLISSLKKVEERVKGLAAVYRQVARGNLRGNSYKAEIVALISRWPEFKTFSTIEFDSGLRYFHISRERVESFRSPFEAARLNLHAFFGLAQPRTAKKSINDTRNEGNRQRQAIPLAGLKKLLGYGLFSANAVERVIDILSNDLTK